MPDFSAGRYDEASLWVEEGLRQANSAVAARNAAMGYALAGRSDQAQKAIARLRQIDPTPQVSYIRRLRFAGRRTSRGAKRPSEKPGYLSS